MPLTAWYNRSIALERGILMKKTLKKIATSLLLAVGMSYQPTTIQANNQPNDIVVDSVVDSVEFRAKLSNIKVGIAVNLNALTKAINKIKPYLQSKALGLTLFKLSGLDLESLHLTSLLYEPLVHIAQGMVAYAEWLVASENPLIAGLYAEEKMFIKASLGVACIDLHTASKSFTPSAKASAESILDFMSKLSPEISYLHKQTEESKYYTKVEIISGTTIKFVNSRQAINQTKDLSAEKLAEFLANYVTTRDLIILNNFLQQRVHIKIQSNIDRIIKAFEFYLPSEVFKSIKASLTGIVAIFDDLGDAFDDLGKSLPL